MVGKIQGFFALALKGDVLAARPSATTCCRQWNKCLCMRTFFSSASDAVHGLLQKWPFAVSRATSTSSSWDYLALAHIGHSNVWVRSVGTFVCLSEWNCHLQGYGSVLSFAVAAFYIFKWFCTSILCRAVYFILQFSILCVSFVSFLFLLVLISDEILQVLYCTKQTCFKPRDSEKWNIQSHI